MEREVSITPLKEFDHQLLQNTLLADLGKHRQEPFQELQPPQELHQQQIWADVYSELTREPTQPERAKEHLVFSWDSFCRPIASKSSLAYHTPYQVEESVSDWENILSPTQSKISSPIDRITFITRFFRRSIGLKNPTPLTHHTLKPRTDNNNPYPRIYGLTDLSTRSLYELSDAAFANLTSIESFVRLTHHPYHPHQSLSSGLAILVDWIRIEIMDCFQNESVFDCGLLTISLMIDPLLELINALAKLVKSCQENDKLRQEDVVYQHLNLHISQSSSSLIQAVLSWLLDRVCATFLLSWQTWLGIDLGGQRTLWVDEKDQLYETLWHHYGIQPAPNLNSNLHHDLTGDSVDQNSAKAPSRYYFRRDRVPSFIPITLAQSVFKAGTSLRILRRSNPFHPICLTYPIEEYGQSRWVWTPQELEKAQDAFTKQRREMKRHISAWRHGVKMPDDTSLVPTRRAIPRSPTGVQNIEQVLDIDHFLKKISTGLKPYGNQAGGTPDVDRHRKGLIETLEERLRHCQIDRPGLLHSLQLPSLDILTEVTVLESLRCRSQEIDRCLLSFFLIDLEFLDHLRILDQFMFCNDVMFDQRLTNALFSLSDDSLHETGRRPVGVSARLLRRGTWPPGGFDLSFALRTVILDSVAPDQRPASYRDSSAWNELEDRLSFAIRPGIEHDVSQAAYKAESIDGFGFLMIDFKPPEALRSLLGPEVLGQYRIVNTYLMKLLRLQSMMKANWRLIRPRRQYDASRASMPNGARRNRYIETVDLLATHSQRLLDGLVSYTWDIAIGTTWSSFIARVERVKEVIQFRERWSDKQHGKTDSSRAEGLERETGPDHAYEMIESVEQLNKMHRLTLTEIMNCLFLRPKQEGYHSLLSRSILDTIMQFSVHLEQEYRAFCVAHEEGAMDEQHRDRMEEVEREQERLVGTVQKIMMQQFAGTQALLKSLDQLHQRSVDHQPHSSHPHLAAEPARKIGFLKQLIVRLDFNSFFFDSPQLD
ncbi:hypothetical protein PCASD_11317 [Puccinia coronata f. sp. avenae]|uniref:Uncharacterized protein n=1 Tax=Puccinia coronata f. sp. avenae TaxID=200324 RepID=A0A2N5UJJ5_9BASI|nr:hypothetical protein PCASD_11317 [Puccinia coronata f. sp. avenae]